MPQPVPLNDYPTFGRVASWDEWKEATATNLPDSLGPWFISNMLGFILLWIALLVDDDKRRGPTATTTAIARRSWGALMMIAGFVNAFVLWTEPNGYIEFGVLAIPPLQHFIYSQYFFAANPAYLVGPIILGQWAIGIVLLQRTPTPARLKMALIGTFIWFLGIAPLGMGSAFPASLIYASTMLVCWKHHQKQQQGGKDEPRVIDEKKES